MALETIHPWHKLQWQQIWQLRQQARLPHALLFSGIPGIGKKQFAHMLAYAQLCHTPTSEGHACHECRGCHLTRAKSHPDLLIIEPEEAGQMIKVDQVRSVVKFVNETAQQSGYRVIVIDPANAMNINAANALLKTLEEPTPNTLFILLNDCGAKLTATILSRCQKIVFQKPTHAMALSWLQENIPLQTSLDLVLRIANGAPLKALELLENDFLIKRNDFYQGLYALTQRKMDPLQFAVQWQEANLMTIFNLLQIWLRDLLQFKLTQAQDELVNIDFYDVYLQIIQKCSLTNLASYIDHVQAVYVNVVRSINLNRQLLLEELFIQWVKYVPG